MGRGRELHPLDRLLRRQSAEWYRRWRFAVVAIATLCWVPVLASLLQAYEILASRHDLGSLPTLDIDDAVFFIFEFGPWFQLASALIIGFSAAYWLKLSQEMLLTHSTADSFRSYRFNVIWSAMYWLFALCALPIIVASALDSGEILFSPESGQHWLEFTAMSTNVLSFAFMSCAAMQFSIIRLMASHVVLKIMATLVLLSIAFSITSLTWDNMIQLIDIPIALALNALLALSVSLILLRATARPPRGFEEKMAAKR